MYNMMAIAGETTVTDASLSSFLTSISDALSEFSVNNLRTILLAALGITVGLCIAWFAYRFVIRKVQKALHKGSL